MGAGAYDAAADTLRSTQGPVLYITDITDDPNNRSGDWQMGGTAYNPNVIFGSWKAAVRIVDKGP